MTEGRRRPLRLDFLVPPGGVTKLHFGAGGASNLVNTSVQFTFTQLVAAHVLCAAVQLAKSVRASQQVRHGHPSKAKA